MTAFEPGTRHAFLMTAAEYLDPAFRQLRSPVHDAADLGDVLKQPDIGGFDVVTLADRSTEDCRAEVHDFLVSRRPDDTILIYLSCHGILDRSGNLYFVMRDTRKNRLESSAVEASWLLRLMSRCRAETQMLVLDCCFSGAFAGSKAAGDRDRPMSRLTDLARVATDASTGLTVLTASRDYEFSYEGSPVVGQGVSASIFTGGLVDGLRSGTADTDHDGLISIDDAFFHAAEFVQARQANQNPQRWAFGVEGRAWLARSQSPDSTKRVPRAVVMPRHGAEVSPQPASAIELYALEPDNLGVNTILPYALDDQWIPRAMIRQMAIERQSIHDVAEVRDRLTRREYVRALLTARRIVVNRSYLLRNPVISQDYKHDETRRAAFIKLLETGVIVPFLMNESSPVESRFGDDPVYQDNARIWNDLLNLVRVWCVRFVWSDDRRNGELVQARLFDSFDSAIRRAGLLDHRRLMREAGERPSDTIEETLANLSRIKTGDGGLVLSRTGVYERYILEKHTTVAQGRYDFRRADVVALKWLVDLIYNSNLAAALGIGLATPVDSVHRSLVFRPGGMIEPKAISEAARTGYDPAYVRTIVTEAIQVGGFADGYSTEANAIFDGLTLSDVLTIRSSEPWDVYIHAVDRVLKQPWLISHPEDGLPSIYRRYRELLAYIGGAGREAA